MGHKRTIHRRRLASRLTRLPPEQRVKTADHAAKCSCWMCGNPRRHTGEKTIQERRDAMDLHGKLARSHPKLKRGRVWCRKCGRAEKVDSAECLRSGWPKCCGETMTLDGPEERADG